ncbi:amino acid adenylation domain-containing protein [Micromonospora sp. NPDC023956]|uniref:amino acid adenylation domain-containing protein n=1 Tax=Micromonospora sp. NPDC023956 TaxID=3155722 RepID=UPI003405A33E
MPDGLRPLSDAQHGIWTWQQLTPDTSVFNIAEYVEIRGPVDVDRLAEAVRRTVAGTAALQVRFVDDDEQVMLADAPGSACPVEVLDVRDRPDPVRAARDWMTADLDQAVDLTRDPFFRHAIVVVADDRYFWYHRVHHVALDGFGLALIARRVAETYTALVEGREPPPSPFADPALLAAEDAEYTAGPRPARDREYWTDYCAQLPEPVTLASGAATGAEQGSVRQEAVLPPATVDALKTTATRSGVAWTDLFTAAFAAYLGRMSGAGEVVLALPVMLRLGSVALRVPTMTLNVVPLRVTVGAEDDLPAVARRIAADIRASRPHHRYRYEQLRRDLRLVGADQKLFGPAVNVMPFDYGLRFAGHRASVHNLAAGPVDDLMIGLFDRADGHGIRLAVDANARRYTTDDLRRHLSRFLTFLDRALADPAPPVTGVDLLLPGERELLLGAWNATERHLPDEHVPAIFETRARHSPTATALVATDARDGTLARLSFSALNERANRLARHLVRRGAGPGTYVALLLPRTDLLPVALLAVLKSGAAYVPVDPDYPPARIGFLLADAGATVTVTDRRNQERAGLDPGSSVLLDDPETVASIAVHPAHDLTDDDRSAPLTPADPVCLIYTSGSTGNPKGVVLEHRGMTNLYRHHRTHLIDPETAAVGGRRMRAALTASLSFDTSWEGLFWLLAGHELHLLSDDARYDPDQVVGYVDQHRLDFMDVTPTYAEELLRAGLLAPGRNRPAVVALGGEATPPRLWTTLRETDGLHSYNLYGPTECSVDTLWCRLAESPTPIIGRPVTNSRAYVLDERGNLLPPGAIGELYLAGVPLARGYHQRPELTAERFVPGVPGLPDARLYRTGDRARWRGDGTVEFLGRRDDQVKIRGLRIELGEIEAALCTHPTVAQAAVAVRRDPRLGDRLVAYVVPTPDGSCEPSALRAHLGRELPAHLVPAAYVSLPGLPRNPHGKLDRAALPAPPAGSEPAGRAPRDHWEQRLCALVAELLDLPPVSPDDDFFALGGHSLIAARLVRQLRLRYGRDLSVRTLFQTPTLADLAAILAASATSAPGGDEHGDLARDARLAPDLVVTAPASTVVAGPGVILLTGATGFLGSFLLHELLAHTDDRIVCLVRAADDGQARTRIHQALRGRRLWRPELDDRVEAVAGDLTAPALGLDPHRWDRLAGELTAVLHNGARVNHFDSYPRLRPTNVTGTLEVLRLAAGRAVPVHYVSTCDVGVGSGANPARIDPDHLPDATQVLRNGYVASKWVAEQLVRQAGERGLPVTIVRPSRVGGHSVSGVTPTDDAWWSLVRAIVRLGSYPEDGLSAVDLVPVDHVAAAIRVLLKRPASVGSAYHLTSRRPTPPAAVLAALRSYGYELRGVPSPRWLHELRVVAEETAASGDYSLAVLSEHPLAAAASATPVEFAVDSTWLALAGSALPSADIDDAYLHRCVEHLVATGFLPEPGRLLVTKGSA